MKMRGDCQVNGGTAGFPALPGDSPSEATCQVAPYGGPFVDKRKDA